MPRVSDEEKERSHLRIVEAASTLLRVRGLDGAGVADVMQAAGLTHGGFYKHFSTKEEMLAAGLQHAVDDVLGPVEERLEGADAVKDAQRYLDVYLSEEHLRDAAQGCPLAAIAAEAGRREGPARDQAVDAFARTANILSVLAGGKAAKGGPSAMGIALAALAVGAVTLARVQTDPAAARRVLGAARRAARLLRD